ncbi:uncharacterized protein LOC127265547 [Andrographis paniculata]|uniref:uncharacterized protein LOC127265547 n=1 Tax=Andrographis paniculata TaxID=175694 RepID=UPI0021E92446|nr:uncharacterized protein LOC127265547 [Andrographis paniculata]
MFNLLRFVRVCNFGCYPKYLGFPQHANSIIRSFCESANNVCDQQRSQTLSFLINSCKLSPVAATVVSEKLILKSLRNAESVLTILKTYGFSDVQITRLVTKYSKLLSSHPDKTVLPKLRFFDSIGMPHHVLTGMISRCPTLLGSSLDKCIIPFYDYLKNILQSDKKVVRAFSTIGPHSLTTTLNHRASANVDILRKYGVSDSNIKFLLEYHSNVLTRKIDWVVKAVERAIELGMDTSKFSFILAVHTLSCLSKSAWKRKEELYRRCGWSDPDILTAFSLHPYCMLVSEDKIMRTMEFLVKEMDCQPKDIAKTPRVLLYCLDKRVAPRCRVIKLLMEKGLLERSYKLSSLISYSEHCFLERFVRKHGHVPELLEVYRGVRAQSIGNRMKNL